MIYLALASEAFIVGLFEDANLCAVLGGVAESSVSKHVQEINNVSTKICFARWAKPDDRYRQDWQENDPSSRPQGARETRHDHAEGPVAVVCHLAPALSS